MKKIILSIVIILFTFNSFSQQQIIPTSGSHTVGSSFNIANQNFTELYNADSSIRDSLESAHDSITVLRSDLQEVVDEITAQQTTESTLASGILDLSEARTFYRTIGSSQSFELQNVELNQFFTIVATTGSGSFATPFFTHATLTCAIETDSQSWWPSEPDGSGGTVSAYDNTKAMEGSFKVMRITGTHIYLRQNLVNK